MLDSWTVAINYLVIFRGKSGLLKDAVPVNGWRERS